MGVRAATIWVLLASCLALVLLWLRAPATETVSGGSFRLGLDPASVVALRVTTPGGAPQEALRRPDASWMLSWGRGEGRRWPAAEGSLRAGLRLLATHEFDPREAPAVEEAGLATLTVELRGGIETAITLTGQPVGGRVPVRLSTGNTMRPAWAELNLTRSLFPTPGSASSGLAAWSERSLATEAARADSIRLRALDESVSLRRLGARWVLQEPVLIEADPDVVRAALDAIAGLEIDRFLDDANTSDPAFGLDRPAGEVALSWSDRGGDAGARAMELTLGSRADATTNALHTLVTLAREGETLPPRLAVVQVPAFPVTPDAYLRKFATTLTTADLRAMTLRNLPDRDEVAALTRDVDGWRRGDEPDRDQLATTIADLASTRPADSAWLLPDEDFTTLQGLLLEIGLVVGGGVEAENLGVALPTEEAPTLRLIGKPLEDGSRPVWSYAGADADRLVNALIDLLEL
ncbi:MAG: DUF4340 domain-containing protein [Phycisphaerales bacterium JB040]